MSSQRDQMRENCKNQKDAILEFDNRIRQLKIKSSEQISMSLEQQSKQFRAGYNERLQKVYGN